MRFRDALRWDSERSGRANERDDVDNYPLLNLFLTMLYLFLWVAWILLLFRIVGDIFRSRDLSGGAKAGWVLLILVLPWLGALIYLVARGSEMHARDIASREAVSQAMRELIAENAPPAAAAPAVSPASAADQLSKLAELRQSGVLTEEEFAAQKAKILA